jgi:hypothetical protein
MIEFQYFDACPNAVPTLKNLKEVIDELGIPNSEFGIVEIMGFGMAESLNFQGYPTILIDGFDIYSKSKPESYNFSCRYYDFDGIKTGVIPKHFIKKKLINAFSIGKTKY